MKKQTKLNIQIIIGILLICLIITGCSKPINTTGKVNSNIKDNELKIGVIFPLSGPASTFGKDALNGFILGLEKTELNKNKNIKIFIEDGQGDVTTSIAAFNKLVNLDEVDIVYTFISSVGLALKPLAIEKEVLLFADVTHPAITEGNNKLIFRHCQLGDQEAKLLFNEANKLGNKKIGLLMINDDYSHVFLDTFKEESKKHNIKLKHEFYDKKATEVRTQISTLINDNPDSIMIIGYSPTSITAVKTLKELKYKGKIYASFGFSYFAHLAEEEAKGVRYIEFSVIGSEKSKDYEKKYKQKYDTSPGSGSFVLYEDILMLKKAIDDTKSYKIEDISNYIRSKQTIDIGLEKLKINKQDILPEIEIRTWK